MKINDRFTAKRDQYCWHLIETYIGKNKDGDSVEKERVTYHANLKQVLDAVIDRGCGEAETIKDALELSRKIADEFVRAA